MPTEYTAKKKLYKITYYRWMSMNLDTGRSWQMNALSESVWHAARKVRSSVSVDIEIQSIELLGTVEVEG